MKRRPREGYLVAAESNHILGNGRLRVLDVHVAEIVDLFLRERFEEEATPFPPTARSSILCIPAATFAEHAEPLSLLALSQPPRHEAAVREVEGVRAAPLIAAEAPLGAVLLGAVKHGVQTVLVHPAREVAPLSEVSMQSEEVNAEGATIGGAAHQFERLAVMAAMRAMMRIPTTVCQQRRQPEGGRVRGLHRRRQHPSRPNERIRVIRFGWIPRIAALPWRSTLVRG